MTAKIFQNAFQCYVDHPFTERNRPYYIEALQQLYYWKQECFNNSSLAERDLYRHLFLALQDVSGMIFCFEGLYSKEDLAKLWRANVAFKQSYACDSGFVYDDALSVLETEVHSIVKTHADHGKPSDPREALNSLRDLDDSIRDQKECFLDTLTHLRNHNTPCKFSQWFEEQGIHEIENAVERNKKNLEEDENKPFKFFSPLHTQVLIQKSRLTLDQALSIWKQLEQQFDLKYLIMHETSFPLEPSYDLLFGENAQVSIPFMVWDQHSEPSDFQEKNRIEVAPYPEATTTILVGTGRSKWRFWHAGKSSWKNEEREGYDKALNNTSTGIEMVPLKRLWEAKSDHITDCRPSLNVDLTAQEKEDIVYWANDYLFNEAIFSLEAIETAHRVSNTMNALTENHLLIKTHEEISCNRKVDPGIGFFFSKAQEKSCFQRTTHLLEQKRKNLEKSTVDWRSLPEKERKEWAYDTLTLLGYDTRGEGLLSDLSSEKSTQFSHCLRAFSRAHCPETWAFYPQVAKKESVEVQIKIINPWESLNQDTQKTYLEWVRKGRTEGKAHLLIHTKDGLMTDELQGVIPEDAVELAFFPEGWLSWKEGSPFEIVLDVLARMMKESL